MLYVKKIAAKVIIMMIMCILFAINVVQLIVLNKRSVPSINIPKGFSAEQVNVLVNGVCKNCK